MMPLDVHQLDWRGWRERENQKEGLYFTIAFFPTPPLWRWFILSLRGRYATSRHPPTPWAADPRTQSLFHPFFAVAAAGKRRPEEGGLGRAMPLHCTGWGSLLRARRAGDLGANARNRSVPSSSSSSPSTVRLSDARGVQCTVRFSTFIIRCARAPAEGTRRWRPSRFSGEGLMSIERFDFHFARIGLDSLENSCILIYCLEFVVKISWSSVK